MNNDTLARVLTEEELERIRIFGDAHRSPSGILCSCCICAPLRRLAGEVEAHDLALTYEEAMTKTLTRERDEARAEVEKLKEEANSCERREDIIFTRGFRQGRFETEAKSKQ